MVRRWIIVLAVVVALGVGLVGGYVFWGRGEYVFPPPPGIPEQIRPEPTVILEGSPILSVGSQYMSEEERQEYLAWGAEMESYEDWLETGPFPFNRFGMYVNRFFLQKNEVVEVVIRSPVVMTIDDVGGDPIVYLIAIGRADSFSYSLPSTLDRVNGNWELRFTVRAESDGYHTLVLTNSTPDLIWCQYAVLLRG